MVALAKKKVGAQLSGERIKKLELKIRQLLAKKQLMDNKRGKDRRWLPDQYPAEPCIALKPLIGFVDCTDGKKHQFLVDALSAKTFNAVMDGVSQILACDSARLCLLEVSHGMVVRRAIKTRVQWFRYGYNEAANDIMRENGGSFSRDYRAWSIPQDSSVISKVIGELQKVFKYLVDLETLRVYMSTSETMVEGTQLAFEALSVPIKITADELFDAIARAQPWDEVYSMLLHDGVGFVAFEATPLVQHLPIWTQSPFLMLRYSDSSGDPRHILYSTLNQDVDQVTFGATDKDTNKLFGMYLHTCKRLNFMGGRAFGFNANISGQLQW